ncbi:MFS transporter [Desulfallas sp. Bu1-1]|uniref:MFS transporter n=1 Tax=Desulfallas sp. Bu1-1 TaxID=2787620 RepID=UPI00189E227B|nr:MFS transporter [Desulfallas sp. Bu1-1]MBF7081811.1 MFS transporter [Desulfallas sp. Bu1-1]
MEPGRSQFKAGRFASIHYGWTILVMGIFVVAGALGLARFGYGMILPSMQQSLNLTHNQTGFIASANMFGYFISALIAGLLATRFGPRAIIAIALLWTGLTMILTGLVHGPYQAALTRFLTGVGSAGSNVSVMGLASAWFAPTRRGMATGFLVGGSGLAIAFTGWVVPYVNEAFQEAGWRYNWFILGGIVILVGIASWLVLRNHPSEKNLMPIGVGFKMAQEETTTSNPPGVKDLLRINGVPWLAALYFCFGFSYIITATFLVTFLINEIKCTEELAGSIWGTVGMLSIGSCVVWGILSDKFGRRSILITVFLVQALCYTLLLFKFSTGFLLWLPAILYGLTAWSIPGLAASCCGDISDAKRAPAVLGLITFVFGFGQVLGPIIAGYVKEHTSSFTGAFLLAAVLAALGAFFSSRLIITKGVRK